MTTTAPAPGYYRLAREINNPSKPDRRRTAPLRGWKRSSVSAGELVRVEHRSETFQGNPITIVVAAALREVNRIRVSLGRSPAYPRFGTALFGV